MLPTPPTAHWGRYGHYHPDPHYFLGRAPPSTLAGAGAAEAATASAAAAAAPHPPPMSWHNYYYGRGMRRGLGFRRFVWVCFPHATSATRTHSSIVRTRYRCGDVVLPEQGACEAIRDRSRQSNDIGSASLWTRLGMVGSARPVVLYPHLTRADGIARGPRNSFHARHSLAVLAAGSQQVRDRQRGKTWLGPPMAQARPPRCRVRIYRFWRCSRRFCSGRSGRRRHCHRCGRPAEAEAGGRASLGGEEGRSDCCTSAR